MLNFTIIKIQNIGVQELFTEFKKLLVQKNADIANLAVTFLGAISNFSKKRFPRHRLEVLVDVQRESGRERQRHFATDHQ